MLINLFKSCLLRFPLETAGPPQCCSCQSKKYFQIALVGLGIHPRNGQRENFTHEPPCFHTNSFGVPITIKLSLTSGFFQKFASSHHSSFMMPAWGLLQQKMTQKILINRKLTRFEPMCSLISRKQRPHTDVTI